MMYMNSVPSAERLYIECSPEHKFLTTDVNGRRKWRTPSEFVKGCWVALSGSGEVCITFPEGATAGKPVKVEATSKIDWLPILKLEATSTTLRGTAYMRLETTPSAFKAGCST